MRFGDRQKERLVLTLVYEGTEPAYSGKEGDIQRRLMEMGCLERGKVGGFRITTKGRREAELVLEHDLQGRHEVFQRGIVRDENDHKAVLRWMRENTKLQPALIDCERAMNNQENPRFYAVRAVRHLYRLDSKLQTNDVWNAIAALENGLSYQDEQGVRDSASSAREHLRGAQKAA